MNVITNKALRRYVDWEANAEKFGTVTTSASTIKKFFDYLSESQAKEMGLWWGENQVPGIVTYFFKKFDLESVLKALEFLGAQYGRAFTFDHSFDGKTHTLIVKHDMGYKASVFYAEAAKAAFAHLGLATDMFVTEDQLIAISPPDPGHPNIRIQRPPCSKKGRLRLLDLAVHLSCRNPIWDRLVRSVRRAI